MSRSQSPQDSMNQHLPALRSPTLWQNPELPRLSVTRAMPTAIFVAPTMTAAANPINAPVPVTPQPVSAFVSAPTPIPTATPSVAPVPQASTKLTFIASPPDVQPKLQAVLPSQFPTLPLPKAMATTVTAASTVQIIPTTPAPATVPTVVAAAFPFQFQLLRLQSPNCPKRLNQLPQPLPPRHQLPLRRI